MVNLSPIQKEIFHYQLVLSDFHGVPANSDIYKPLQELAQIATNRLIRLYSLHSQEFNIMATEFLEDKINHLKNQVRQEKMSIFQFDLAIADAEGPTGNATVDEQLKTTAQSNELGKIMSVRKLAVRQKILDELQAEFEATKSSS
jgi:hypothetical protein